MSTEPLVRDLTLVREADLARRSQQVREALLSWAPDWLPLADAWQPALEAVCTTDGSLALGDCAWLGTQAGWAKASQAAQHSLAARLVGREDRHSSAADADWALQAASEALNDLHARILGGCPGPQIAPPDGARMAGLIVVREASLGLAWAWKAAPSMPVAAGAAASKRSTSAVAPLSGSLSHQRVQLTVGLGAVEIAMSDLLALQVGDVIRFPAALKAPVPVLLEGSRHGSAHAAFHAKLGQLAGHVAVQLISKSDPLSPSAS